LAAMVAASTISRSASLGQGEVLVDMQLPSAARSPQSASALLQPT